MTPIEVVNVVQCGAGLAFLVWFFYGPWQTFVLDTLRQNLFEMRDEIFLIATDEKIAFDSNEYRNLRDRFNSAIRYAHEITWTQVLAFSCSSRQRNRPADPQLREVIANIDNDAARERILDLFRKASILIVLSIVLRSPILIATNMLAAPFMMVYLLLDWSSLKERVARPLRDLVERDLRALSS